MPGTYHRRHQNLETCFISILCQYRKPRLVSTVCKISWFSTNNLLFKKDHALTAPTSSSSVRLVEVFTDMPSITISICRAPPSKNVRPKRIPAIPFLPCNNGKISINLDRVQPGKTTIVPGLIFTGPNSGPYLMKSADVRISLNFLSSSFNKIPPL